jgi:hypothetical protein
VQAIGPYSDALFAAMKASTLRSTDALVFVLNLLTRDGVTAPPVVEIAHFLHERSGGDVAYLVAVLPGLELPRIWSMLPGIVMLPAMECKRALHGLLHAEPPRVTPVELLVALHLLPLEKSPLQQQEEQKQQKKKKKNKWDRKTGDISKSAAKHAVATVDGARQALGMCLTDMLCGTPDVLMATLQKVSQQPEWSRTLLYSLAHTLEAFPELSGFAMSLLRATLAQSQHVAALDDPTEMDLVLSCVRTAHNQGTCDAKIMQFFFSLPRTRLQDVLTRCPELLPAAHAFVEHQKAKAASMILRGHALN